MAKRSEPFRADRPSIVELASGGVVRRAPDGALLLLHETAEDRWCLPKGHVEEGESLEAAARREIQEEAGLEDLEFGGELGEVHYRFFSPRKGVNVLKTVVYFAVRTRGTSRGLESGFDELRWVSDAEAQELVRFEADRRALTAGRRDPA